MTTEIILTCDRCNRRVLDPSKLWAVAVVVVDYRRFVPGSSAGAHSHSEHRKEWCDDCVREIGILPKPKVKNEEPEPPLSLEDLVREIAQEEIEAATGARA